MKVEKIRELIAVTKQKVRETDHHLWASTKTIRKVTEVHNNVNGSSSYSTHHEVIPIVDVSTLHYIIEELQKTNTFKEIVKDLVEEHPLAKEIDNPEVQTEFWLETFLNNIIRAELERRLDETKEFEMIMTLKDEFDKVPIGYEARIFLNGFYIENEKISISKDIELRQPKPADMEIALQKSSVLDGHISVPSAVALVHTKGEGNRIPHPKQDILLTILGLFRLGSVFGERAFYNNHSVIWPGSQGMGMSMPGRYSTNYRFLVKSYESESLISFYKTMEEKLLHLQDNSKQNASIQIALGNFKNSLIEPIESERRLFSTIIGLEALFTQSGEFGETSYRLAMRLGKFLGLLGFKSQDIKNLMEKCYKIRNKVGHGLLLEDKERNESQEYVKSLLDYLRQSIILFLLCLEDKTKGDLINSVDKAMVDEKYGNEFGDWVKEKISTVPKEVFLTN